MQPSYRERLWPSPAIWALAPGLGLVLGLALTPVGDRVGPVAAVVGATSVLALLVRGTVTVQVDRQTLTAGRAGIPVGLLGDIQVLDGSAMRHARGVGLDARAYLCLRGWLAEGVRIELVDPDDPTPYWLVSSRRPAVLAAALGEAVRAASGSGPGMENG